MATTLRFIASTVTINEMELLPRSFFEHLVASIGDGVIAVDDDGFVTHLNPIAVDLTGWESSDAVGKPIEDVFEIVNEHSRAIVPNPVRKVLQTGQIVELANHTILIAKDGREMAIDDSASPMSTEDGSVRGAVLIFRSVEIRRRLQRQENELRRLSDLHVEVGTALATCTDQTQMLQRVCTALVEHLDASFVRIWTVDNLQQHLHLVASVGNEDSSTESHREIDFGVGTIGRIASTAEPFVTNDVNAETLDDVRWATDKDTVAFAGYPLVVERENGNRDVIGVAAVFADRDLGDFGFDALKAIANVTAAAIDRFAILAAKRTNDRLYRSMIHQIRDYAVFTTDCDGNATTWNEGVEKVLGYTRDEFIGMPVKDRIFTQAAIDDGIPQWEFNTAKASGSSSDDRWMRRKDETTFWASGITTAIKDSEGELIGFSKVLRDLTHRKDAEDAVRQLNAELSLADHRKNNFLATLAHELRNPLSPMTSALELMRDTEVNSEELSTLRDLVARQVDHMVRLVDDLLDISRISLGSINLRRCQCRLQPIIQQAIEAVQPFLGESNHVMKIEIHDRPIFLDADPARLSQVVTNLLHNAAKYTPESGRIELSVALDGDDAVITVKDNGIGIEPDKLKVVFDMFAQADVELERGKAGLGIGLALVKTLVAMHDGTITVESEGRNCGTIATVRLPTIPIDHVDREADLSPRRSEGADGRSKDSGGTESSVALRLQKVLVIDDVFAIRFTLSRLLAKLGHSVETAGAGDEALAMIPEFEPDVIFSDISMPKMNGYDLAAKIREQFDDRGIVLVAMTGFGQEADRYRAMESGFDHHMVKPPDVRVLQEFFMSLHAGG